MVCGRPSTAGSPRPEGIATGSVPGANILEFRDGQISWENAWRNTATLLAQLGAPAVVAVHERPLAVDQDRMRAVERRPALGGVTSYLPGIVDHA